MGFMDIFGDLQGFIWETVSDINVHKSQPGFINVQSNLTLS